MWQIVCTPDGRNPGVRPGEDGPPTESKNFGSMIVSLRNEDAEHEVSRVAFVRQNSINPDTAFRPALLDVIERAEICVDTLRKYCSDSGDLA